MRLGLFLLILSLGVGSVHAQTNLAIGGTSGSWLDLPESARIEGMGEAFVAVADDVNCLAVNPAGLGQIQGTEISLTHDSWIQGAIEEQAVASMSVGTGHLTVGLNYANFGDVPGFAVINGNTPVATGTFQPTALLADIGYGFPTGKGLYVGAAGKIFQDSLDSDPIIGFAGDLGLLLKPEDSQWSFGLSALNIGSLAGAATPFEWRLGAAYQLVLNEAAGTSSDSTHKLLFSVDGLIPFLDVNSSRLALGAEYWYHDTVALRAGQQFQDDAGLGGWDGFSAGLGLRIAKFEVDYAFATRGDLGNVNLVSLLTRFE